MIKQFTINDCRVLSDEQVLKILNQLVDENERLKKLCSILKEKIQFYEDQVVNPECPICHTILQKISIDSKKDRYYRKCPKCGYEREESLI